jgi:hypothetical protein
MSLDPSRFSLDEYVNQNWTLTVEAGTSLEDVLNPAFLANVANKLSPYDHIRVRVDTGEWYAELLVTSCGRAWAKLHKLYEVKLVNPNEEAMQEDAMSQFLIQHRGAHLKFCVVRKSDNEPIKEQLTSKQEAQGWLTSYLLTL